jgi:hypothetical protein
MVMSADYAAEWWSASREQLGLGLDGSPSWLYSALLMALVLGGMRTTRRQTLWLLHVLCGELWGWGKTCVLSPFPLYRAVRQRLPSSSRRQLRNVLRMLLGRKAARHVLHDATTTSRLGIKGKHSLKHGKRRLNKTVSSKTKQSPY